MNRINLADFSADTDTRRFALAMEYMRSNPGTELFVPRGEYTITSDLAKEAMEHVFNGDWGENPQKIMFNPKYKYTRGISFEGQRGSVVSAYGVKLIIDGFMEPISLINCSDIEIRGLTIDHKRKPYSRGVLESFSQNEKGQYVCLFRLDRECAIKEKTPINMRQMFFDPEEGCNIFPDIQSCEYRDAFTVEIVLEDITPRRGIEVYIFHVFHARPGILIENAENIRLTDVTIHSQPGMGIVGNRSENITLTRLKVVPSEGHHMSTNTDATHFTSVKGLLRFEDCTFYGHGDDFTNVHAFYQAIIGQEGEKTYRIQEKTPDGTHAQSLDYPDVGDTMELVDRDSLEVLGHYTVIACTTHAEDWCCSVTLDRPLPKNTENLFIADITRLPRLEIISCRAYNHFARSILVKSRDTLIENCYFEGIMGPAIVASSETRWSEGVSPANIVIRNNHIKNCNTLWGEGAIIIGDDCETHKSCTVKNVIIENNTLDSPKSTHGIVASYVENIVIRDNDIRTRGEAVSSEQLLVVSC